MRLSNGINSKFYVLLFFSVNNLGTKVNMNNPVVKLNLSDKVVYVVGDVHGRFDLLNKLLDQVNFDPCANVLIACGDLIDRGEHSIEMLNLLKQNYFYSVRGNHEDLLLDFFEHYIESGKIQEKIFLYDEDPFIFNGGGWVKKLYSKSENKMSSEFDEFIQLIKRMPFVICVEIADKRFNVIHAQATRPFKLRDKEENFLWLDSDFDHWYETKVMPESAAKNILWGRTIMHSYQMLRDIKIYKGLSDTYCGHTPYHIGEIRKLLSHNFLDTGAYLSSKKNNHWGLTMVNAITNEKYVAVG